MIWSFARVSDGTCDSSTKTWVFLGIASAFINIVFSIYIYVRFSRKILSGEMSVSETIYKLFMYDWGVCMYMVFLVWMVVWIIVAGTKRNDARDGDDCKSQLGALTVMFVLYLAVGGFLVFLSLFTECCREPRWRGHTRVPVVRTGILPVQPVYRQPQQQQSGVPTSNIPTSSVSATGVRAALFCPAPRESKLLVLPKKKKRIWGNSGRINICILCCFCCLKAHRN